MKRNTWIGLAALVIVAGGTGYLIFRKPTEEIKWRTAKVDRGAITQRISATGTLNALVQVPVGTQVSGVVTSLSADFNSLVKKGQVIAQIDPTVWETQLRDAESGLARAQAAYENAKVDFDRNKRLFSQELVAQSDLDAKELALETAKGNLDSAKAGLARAKMNLGYCTITAPVDGVVVSRLVDVGQTVAASFSTPNLFTIAQDLTRMKVQAAIDESDIGRVAPGQKAFFTVDSYPDMQFSGVVSEVQLNPTITNNVVTYNVVMEVTNAPKETMTKDASGKDGGGQNGRSAERGNGESRKGGWSKHQSESSEIATSRKKSENAVVFDRTEGSTARYIPAGSPVYKGDLALFPGMTANITIITSRKQDTLRVPSSALRFNMSAYKPDEDKRSGNAQRPQGPQGGGQGAGAAARGMVARREDRLWVLDQGKPKAISVKAGISDGQFTEVTGDGITEGMVVITGVEDLKKAQTASASPFGGPGGGPRR